MYIVRRCLILVKVHISPTTLQTKEIQTEVFDDPEDMQGWE